MHAKLLFGGRYIPATSTFFRFDKTFEPDGLKTVYLWVVATFAGNSFTYVRKNTTSKTIASVVSERLRTIFDVDGGVRNVRI